MLASPRSFADPTRSSASSGSLRPAVRLLFVTHSFPPRDRPLSNVGGMQRVAVDLHRAMSEHPRVILATEAIYTSWTWTAARTSLFLPKLLASLPRRIRREQIDVVVFSSMVTASLAPLLCRRTRSRSGRRTKFVAIAHGHDVTMAFPPYQRWLRRVFGALDAVLPVSYATAEACEERGARPEQIHVCPNGIRLDRFGTLPERADARQHLLDTHALPADAFVLASVGRQVKRKGTAWFVEHVLPRLRSAAAYFLVAGSGPEDEAIRQAAAQAGVSDRLRLLGRVPEADLATLLRGADVFVMPNVQVEGDMEGFGVVMLEAGLCELPVVAAALEGIQDVVADAENGFLVPPEDPAAFAEQIRVLIRDRELRDLLGERARAYVMASFSWPAVARRTVRHLQDLVATGSTI
ncbi:MAG: glycosyltransferase family 4 protein [Bacteroidota bacterium]